MARLACPAVVKAGDVPHGWTSQPCHSRRNCLAARRFNPPMRLNALYATGAVLCALSAAAHAAEYRETFTLREPLGQTWTDELVHHDLAIPQPKVGAAAIALADAAGNPVPVQVEALESKPDGVCRARLWLKTTLPAGQSVSYTVTWNADG
ncbi:MAG: hypothetical protein NTY65_09705, partial [Planctomycetota bacterium]|nr:hypothetical protein [Planctomycetota bacterium]